MLPLFDPIQREFLSTEWEMGGRHLRLLIYCSPIFLFQTRDDMRRGDMISAASDSRWAFTLNMMALVLGLLGNLAWITYTIYLISIPSVPSVSYNVEYPTFANIHPFPMS
ncbi:hypothetical protein XELAEV_18036448mg [Xenopus laevis]|uniref:Uncharacterized protein n=1 Tax=Xenopus laevis TaxID=8355 RepID=A0A974HDG8_XENLA|nr:hypothetical protein XELAEV_18036448mg [Xenopus laevis]